MSKDNMSITIKFPSLKKEIKTDTDTIQSIADSLKNKKKRKNKGVKNVYKNKHQKVS